MAKLNDLNFKFKLASKKKLSGRLVVHEFFRIVVDPIFDEGDFFRSRFLGTFRQSSTNKPVVILIGSPFPKMHRGVHSRYAP